MTTDTERVPTIYECMGRILAELPAIGKNQVNTQQQFKFRGIDDVLQELNPLLGRHGVFYMPEVIERVTAQRSTKSGGIMWEVSLHVAFTFYGPAGDTVRASAWGEGTDSGDKATAKAHTGAMKVALVQAFAISTEEQHEHDQDRHTDEETIPAAVASVEEITALRDRLAAVVAANGGSYPDPWTAPSNPMKLKVEGFALILSGERPPPTPEAVHAAHSALDVWDAPQGTAEPVTDDLGPCSKCGSARTKRVIHAGAVVCEIVKGCDDRAAARQALPAGSVRPDITDAMILSPPSDLSAEDVALVEAAFTGPDRDAMEGRAQALLAEQVSVPSEWSGNPEEGREN